MENKGRRCYSCLRYSAYYTKEISFFDKLNYGRCSLDNKLLQDKHGTCEFWYPKLRRSLRQAQAAYKALCEASEAICMLRQVLTEDDEKE